MRCLCIAYQYMETSFIHVFAAVNLAADVWTVSDTDAPKSVDIYFIFLIQSRSCRCVMLMCNIMPSILLYLIILRTIQREDKIEKL